VNHRQRDVESVHLLTGFGRCAGCGASFYPLSRSHGSRRVFYYGCSAHHKRGKAVCTNGAVMRKTCIDDAVLREIGGHMLRPAAIDAVVEGVLQALAPEAVAPPLERTRTELAAVEREIARLVEALALGGEMASLVSALKARQTRQCELQRTLAEASAIRPQVDRAALERHVRDRAAAWPSMLTGSVEDGRQLFREILVGPIRFTPEKGAKLVYRFKGELAFGRLFSGVAGLAPFMASPSIPSWNHIASWVSEMQELQRILQPAA
jgi:hypothetical protein